MGTGTRTTAQYRDLATQCLDRAQSAQTKVERLYFLEQAAVWHRLAAADQDDRASKSSALLETSNEPSPADKVI